MILAQVNPGAIGALGTVGLWASVALNVALLFKVWTGKDGERQIEPTQIFAIQKELKEQTTILNRLDREMGEVRQGTEDLEKRVDRMATEQKSDTENMFRRINAISVESAKAIQAATSRLRHREG